MKIKFPFFSKKSGVVCTTKQVYDEKNDKTLDKVLSDNSGDDEGKSDYFGNTTIQLETPTLISSVDNNTLFKEICERYINKQPVLNYQFICYGPNGLAFIPLVISFADLTDTGAAVSILGILYGQHDGVFKYNLASLSGDITGTELLGDSPELTSALGFAFEWTNAKILE